MSVNFQNEKINEVMGQVGGQQNDYAAVALRGETFLNNNNGT